ncbi:kelch-like protein 11 [Mya arenaria]|uniref:kelch-like protein 11 n=1 Tax=Mya arenaria TaxID=6604 RepID=UPI0022E56EC6|nr:kelch-like protein 11 [Mya arenaria]
MEFEQGYEHTYVDRKLLKEVNEQNAHLCDVPVQVGGRVRRFHSCILKESGFFNTLFNTGKFREHFHGVVEIRERRSHIFEGAILFLYNMEPTLDIYNIWEFFDIAEFLMIPRLKAFCVKWLEQTKKTNNLIEICLPICTLFDVDITAVIDYIRQNLRELMNGSELRYVDVNSLNNLLSDKHLSYVSMEIKFRFLLKWVKFDFLNRFQYFEPMCAFIDFWKLSETILVAAKQDSLFSLLDVVSNCEYVQHYDESKAFLTVITTHQDLGHEKENVIIYDDIENEWYRLNISLSCTGRSKYFTNTIDKSTFYRVRKTYQAIQ